jgi:predicted permease
MADRVARRLAAVAYRELAFQSIYALRQGNTLPPGDRSLLVQRARRRVTQSKFLVCLLIALVTLGSTVALAPGVEDTLGPGVPRPVYIGTVLVGLLLLEITLLWTTGLQILPTFLGARILPLLESLPVSSRALDRAALITLLRLFDAPAAMCVVATPLAVGLALRSAWAGVAILPGSAAAVTIGIGLALATGRFFVRRVQGARGSPHGALLRWAYLVLWAVPAFAIYLFVSFSPEFLRAVAALLAAGDPSAVALVLLAFPFPLALLPTYALGQPPDLAALPSLGALGLPLAAAVYTALVAGLAYALLRAPRRLAREVSDVAARPLAGDVRRLRPVGVGRAILVKDLRTASRTPGYAFLILLPLLDAIVIGLSSYVGNPRPSDVFNVGAAAVSTAALLATFFGPAFFATEVMGYSYTRTLPLASRSILIGKATLIALVYLLASAFVLGLTLLRVFTPLLFVAFVIAELPGLLAAAFLELGILFRRAETTGVPLTNLYSGAWWATAVVIPGLFVAGLPLLVFELLRAAPGPSAWALPSMAALALAELALFAPFALGAGSSGGRRGA